MASLGALERQRGGGPLQLLGCIFFCAVVVERCCAVLAQSAPAPVTCLPEATTAKATLTPDAPSAVLSCPAAANEQTVPTPFDGTNVCSSPTVTTANDCHDVQFSQIFPQAGSARWWTDAANIVLTTGATLNIPAASFPRYGQKFYVRCASNDGRKHCVLTVEVTGKKGGQVDQKVTCAYNENKTYLVALSKTAPSFTLDCGAVGVVHPSTNSDSFCTAEVTDGRECAPQPYSTIFDSYKTSWWSLSNDGVRTFTVPQEGFPAATKTLYVACSGPKKTGGEQNYCNVAVTVHGSAAGGGSGDGTVTTTSTKSAAHAASHIGVGFLALAAVGSTRLAA